MICRECTTTGQTGRTNWSRIATRIKDVRSQIRSDIMQTFSLASVFVDTVAQPAIGLAGDFWLFPETLRAKYPGLKQVLEDWPVAFETLSKLAEACAANEAVAKRVAASGAHLDLPVRFPNKLIGVGANFIDHLAEMGLPTIRFDPMPIFFMPPSTCMVGPGRTVVKPATTAQFDWEIELVAVIGTRLKDATLEQAREGIAGYTITLDMSARDLIQIGPPFYVDLVRGKAQDTMAPCGPVIMPAAFIDVRDLSLKLWVNDELKQDSSTAKMIFTVEEIICHVSKYVTLEPGDFVTTGSPAGSGVFHNYFLKDGDRIRADIEGVGSLNVEVMDPSSPSTAREVV
jgi:2-keto-4-pentenoate hydratase/2-oxohepta-3-ene-1,7-dioic acid hydratase in catechol pathway